MRFVKAGTIVLLILGAIGYYYFFVDTLRFSDLAGNSGSPIEQIFVNLVDFDTGLTRYDVHRLKQKAGVWNQRISENKRIVDLKERQQADDILAAEMLADPAMRKITQRVLGFGWESAKALIPLLTGG